MLWRNPRATAPERPQTQAEQRKRACVAAGEAVRQVAIPALLSCIAVGLGQILGDLVADLGGALLSTLTLLFCFEAVQSCRLRERHRLGCRANLAELCLLLLALRFGLYLFWGGARLAADVRRWTSKPLTFLDARYVCLAALLALFWLAAFFMYKAFRELDVAKGEQVQTEPEKSRHPRVLARLAAPRTDRQAALDVISRIFFLGGLVVLLLAGAARAELVDNTITLVDHSEIVWYVLAYFAIGLLLLSQASYTTHKSNWKLDGFPVARPVAGRWVLWGVSLVALAAAAASLLPARQSAGGLAWALGQLGNAAIKLLSLILTPLGRLLAYLQRLFGGHEGEVTAMQLDEGAFSSSTRASASRLWEVLRAVLFWLVLAGIGACSVYHILGGRWTVRPQACLARVCAWLMGLRRRLLGATKSATRALRRVVGAQRRAHHTGGQPSERLRLSLRRLSIRARLRYYYVSFRALSVRRGFARVPSATPLEYGETLAGQLPEAASDVQQLTAAFLEARYSVHTLTDETEREARAAWRRVIRTLNGDILSDEK